MPTLSTFIQHSLGSPSQSEGKEIKEIQIGKKKVSCYCLQMTYYTQKTLKMLSENW